MRLEFIGKTKGTIEAVVILSLKMGQSDVKPAVAIGFKVTRANDALNMLDPSLQRFFFTKGNPNKTEQQTLDGVTPVSTLNQLTAAAERIGTVDWDDEQTGCTLVLYHGIDDRPKIVLRDATVKKLQWDNLEGGACDFYFQVHSSDVDAETIGDIGVLKSLEVDFELTAPALISKQKKLDADAPAGGVLTPEKALAATQH